MFQIVLKTLRENAGYSQASFAKTIGVTQSAVGNWESGAREPNFSTLVKIADFFGVSTDYLLGRDVSSTNVHVPENHADTFWIAAAYQAAPDNIRAIVDTALAPYKKDIASSAI